MSEPIDEPAVLPTLIPPARTPGQAAAAAPPAPVGLRADLVLEGGGVKGIGLAGAVIELDAAGYQFARVAGTSAGAIAAALVAALNAAGRPLSQLHDILATVEYPKFMDAGRLSAATHLAMHMGLYDGRYLTDWLGDALRTIGVTTFGQLRLDDPGADSRWSPSQRYSLVVHTADITRGRCVRLPWDYPAYGKDGIDDLLIVDAVRASMSIPFFFEPVRFEAPAGDVDGVHYDAAKITWVDGGLLSNFPVEVFDRTDGCPSRWPTIGLKLSARETTIAAGRDVTNVIAEGIACLHTLLDNADRYYLTSAKSARTIFIDNAGVNSTDFHLDAAAQAGLLANGRTAARAWLAGPGAAANQPPAPSQPLATVTQP